MEKIKIDKKINEIQFINKKIIDNNRWTIFRENRSKIINQYIKVRKFTIKVK